MNDWDGAAYDAHLDNYGEPGIEPCDHPHDQISYRGKYHAECQQCGEPVVTPDPDELWADMEMIDVRWPYPLWTYQSRGEHVVSTRIFLPRIGLVHGE
jgi:hypothetical protein